ncbi:MAG: MFS transporter [Acidobacteria bacterium]|nr:MFS transporter [Acidobacteriota bacterium]
MAHLPPPKSLFPIPHFRYLIAAMLFLATMINYADRLALSVVSPFLRQEFAMSERDYSHVLFFFMTAYAIFYALSGPIMDRLGTRRGFTLSISVWSAAAMSHALASGKWSLAACRFLLGAAEPGNWPAAAKAVAEWFPARQRALGVGIFNAGSSIGSALAPPVVAWLTIQFGWLAAFLWTGAIGFAWLALWLILYQPPHLSHWISVTEWNYLKDQVRPPEETRAAPLPPGEWWRVLRQRECYSLILARFFTDPVIYFIIFWLPEYLRKERHYDLVSIGKYAWVPFIFGDIGYMLGGWFSGFLMGRGWTLPRARKFVLCAGAAVMPAGIFAPLVSDASSAIALTCCMTFGHALWVSNLLTLPTDLFPGRQVGTASGFSGMGGGIGGMLANLGTGYIVQHFSYRPIFLMAGLMHPLSLLLVLWLLPDRRFGDRGL